MQFSDHVDEVRHMGYVAVIDFLQMFAIRLINSGSILPFIVMYVVQMKNHFYSNHDDSQYIDALDSFPVDTQAIRFFKLLLK